MQWCNQACHILRMRKRCTWECFRDFTQHGWLKLVIAHWFARRLFSFVFVGLSYRSFGVDKDLRNWKIKNWKKALHNAKLEQTCRRNATCSTAPNIMYQLSPDSKGVTSQVHPGSWAQIEISEPICFLIGYFVLCSVMNCQRNWIQVLEKWDDGK